MHMCIHASMHTYALYVRRCIHTLLFIFVYIHIHLGIKLDELLTTLCICDSELRTLLLSDAVRISLSLGVEDYTSTIEHLPVNDLRLCLIWPADNVVHFLCRAERFKLWQEFKKFFQLCNRFRMSNAAFSKEISDRQMLDDAFNSEKEAHTLAKQGKMWGRPQWPQRNHIGIIWEHIKFFF